MNANRLRKKGRIKRRKKSGEKVLGRWKGLEKEAVSDWMGDGRRMWEVESEEATELKESPCGKKCEAGRTSLLRAST